MKVYISGRITGLPRDETKEKFNEAEAYLRSLGHEPVNPLNNGLNDSASWNKHMVADIAMLFECEAIYMLTDWAESRGARIEATIATEMELEIILQPEI